MKKALYNPDNPALAGMSQYEREVAIANAKRGVTGRPEADQAILTPTKPHAKGESQ